MLGQLTANTEREGDAYFALFLEQDIASRGATVALARANVKVALKMFFETACASETQRRP